ncbi:flavin-dependent dehydrogenase [Paenibacillus methanolicus]|uniref:Flavin-dependent dehydrogenase n=2 Tax=Paenibacillus methanolicus TaxID=582686 RepID=A0A5S5C288_9BACL|nr:flavin-dependent dehydrogenase [Paenibacillus methanolicus]
MLAAQGLRVALLEAQRHPRRKPCGESVNPGAVQALARLGLPPAAFFHGDSVRIRGWRLHYGRSLLEADFPGARLGMSCPREQLDQWLASEAVRAGAELMEDARVDGLIREAGRVAGVTYRLASGRPRELRAPLVIGADGLRSRIARAAGLSRAGRLRKASFTFHTEAFDEIGDRIELHLQKEIVVGLVPVGGGLANMTIGVMGEHAKHAAGRTEAFVKETASRLPYLSNRLLHVKPVDEVLACGPFDRPNAAAAAGVMLIGDAAGYYDPLTGQGIYKALRSAELAAPHALAALRSGLDWPLQQYSLRLRDEFAASGRLQRMIEYGTRHPLLFRGALGGLRWNRRMRDRIAASIGDIGLEHEVGE